MKVNDGLDADRVMERLYVGAYPLETGRQLAERGFSMVVFCAEGLRPVLSRLVGVEVVWAPNDDSPELTPVRWKVANEAARRVVKEWQRGGRVLVTCRAGLNRSSFVAALAMQRITPKRPMQEIIDQIREHRASRKMMLRPLCNEVFVQTLLEGRPPGMARAI